MKKQDYLRCPTCGAQFDRNNKGGHKQRCPACDDEIWAMQYADESSTTVFICMSIACVAGVALGIIGMMVYNKIMNGFIF